MKKFKAFDVWMSIVMIFLLIAIIITEAYYENDWRSFVLMSYFIIGGWHVVSMLVHTICGWFVKTSAARALYQILSLLLIITMPFGSVWILVFVAPFMAIYYTILCYRETYIKMKRPLDDLK